MKIFYKILSIFVFILCFVSFSQAASIDAGQDQIWPSDGNINLVGSVSGLKGCGLSIMRIHVPNSSGLSAGPSLPIRNNWMLDSAYLSGNDLSIFPGGSYDIELRVSTDGMCSDLSVTHTNFTGSMNLCIPNNGYICGAVSPPSTGANIGGGKSHATRMREEAADLFKDEISIENINLILQKYEIAKNVLFGLSRNYIGGDGQIRYEIDYSNTRDFAQSVVLDSYIMSETKSRSYNIYINKLTKDIIVHYFRVRAVYKDKYSKRSNTIEYVNEDNPLSQYIVRCIDCENPVNFNDIWQTPDLLIEKEFDASCDISGTCNNNKVRYNDILDNIFYVPVPQYYDIFK